jgi:hypothetical protein
MGYDNGGTSTRVHTDIVKKYYTITQACDLINKELELDSKLFIIPQTIMYWRKKGLINFAKTQGSQIKISPKELDYLKAFVFLHTYLGIRLGRIKDAAKFLNNSILHGITAQKLNYYTSLYDKNH